MKIVDSLEATYWIPTDARKLSYAHVTNGKPYKLRENPYNGEIYILDNDRTLSLAFLAFKGIWVNMSWLERILWNIPKNNIRLLKA